MAFLFLPGPLAAPEVRAAFGPGATSAEPAVALGHAVQGDPAHGRLALVPAPGREAPGVLIGSGGPAADAARRLLVAMGGSDLRLEARLPDGSSVLARAVAAPAAPEAPPAPGDGPDQPALLREIILEFLGQPPQDDPGAAARLVAAIALRAAARVRGAARSAPRALGSPFGPGDVDPGTVAWPYGAFFAVESHRLRHRRHDGSMTGPVDRAVFTSGDAVTVVPFDPARGTVLLVEQFRAGPAARRDPRPWSIEAVAGRCDGLESPEATARREAVEEAGLALGRLVRAAAYYPSPGIASEFITSFVGEADLGAAGGLHGLAEEDEDIRALVVPLEAALDAAESGEIANAPLLVTLHWLARHRDRLVAAWMTEAAAPAPEASRAGAEAAPDSPT